MLKFDPPQELAEKIERDVVDNNTSRQKIVLHALEWYYNESLHAEEVSLLKQELKFKDDLLASKIKEVEVLTGNLEWLRGEYALVTVKLLPAAEKTMESKSWGSRIKHFFGFGTSSSKSAKNTKNNELIEDGSHPLS